MFDDTVFTSLLVPTEHMDKFWTCKRLNFWVLFFVDLNFIIFGAVPNFPSPRTAGVEENLCERVLLGLYISSKHKIISSEDRHQRDGRTTLELSQLIASVLSEVDETS